MAGPVSTEVKFPALSARVQVCALLLGLLVLVGAGVLYFQPPRRATKEVVIHPEAKENSTKQVDVDSDPSTVVIALLTAGIALVVYGLNGVRITKLSSPIVNAETTVTEGTADKQVATDEPKPNIPQQQLNAPALTEIQQAQYNAAVQIMRYYLSASSWNGLKVSLACQLAAGSPAKQFSLRALCATDTRMSYDYAYGYLVATSSLGVFSHTVDQSAAVVTVDNFNTVYAAELTEEIARRVAADPADAPLKQIELGAVRRLFSVA